MGTGCPGERMLWNDGLKNDTPEAVNGAPVYQKAFDQLIAGLMALVCCCGPGPWLGLRHEIWPGLGPGWGPGRGPAAASCLMQAAGLRSDHR